jgi:(p)ppGpp synthase/HD superfamily hydrolase
MELYTNWHTWQRTEPELRGLLPGPDADAVASAVEFAVRYHGGQTRPTGAPYAEHLLEALEFLVRGAGVTDPGILQAAVLHDVVEDTPCTIDDIRRAFGGRVAELVAWVTKPAAEEGSDRRAAKEAYLGHLRDAPDDAVVVKLADRASNVQTLRNLGLPKQRQYYAETVRYIMPLAAQREWWANWYSSWQRAHWDLA